MQRARQSDVEAGQRWQLGGVYQWEHRAVNQELTTKAAESVGKGRYNTPEKEQDGIKCCQQLAAQLAVEAPPNPLMLKAAHEGEFKKRAGHDAARWLFLAAFCLFFLAEIAIFVGMWYVTGASPIIIVQGAVLAGGGWLVGHGLSRLVLRQPFKEYLQSLGLTPPEAKPVATSLLIMGVGAAVVAGIAYMRSSGDDSDAAVVVIGTCAIAMMVALFDVLREDAATKYDLMWELEFQAQCQHAAERHLRDCMGDDPPKSVTKGVWYSHYLHEVARLAPVVRDGDYGASQTQPGSGVVTAQGGTQGKAGGGATPNP